MEWVWVGLVVGWLLCAGLAVYVDVERGRSFLEGFVLGLMFGPLGVVAAGLLPVDEARRASWVRPP